MVQVAQSNCTQDPAPLFEESSRAVTAWMSLNVVGHCDLSFCDKGWIMLTKSNDEKYSAVFKMYYQISHDPLHGSGWQEDPKAVDLSERVLKELTGKTRCTNSARSDFWMQSSRDCTGEITLVCNL
ncbi:hypothetical protein FI667_g11694, partial [Globisporangium splendens]